MDVRSPSPPQQFTPPRYPLSKRTSSKNALSDTYRGDAPTTPPRRRPRKKGKAPVSRDNRVNADTSAGAFNPRHSHGLSWSSTTRDSVVMDLLSSLDGLSSQDIMSTGPMQHEEYDGAKYMFVQPPQYPPSSAALRARGHTYSSSMSSDYDRHGMEDSPASRYSNQVASRGRRSNSSSNVVHDHSTAGRLRPGPRPPGRSSSDTQKPTEHAKHARGKGVNGSRSSDNSSVDFGYGAVLDRTRLAWGGRSASMDQIYAEHVPRKESLQSSSGTVSNSILERGRPVPSVHSKYEVPFGGACPEPNVPNGPRRLQNPTAQGPVYVNPAPSKPSALRKTTTQSDLRSASKPTPAIPQDIRDQASDFVRLNSMRDLPQKPGSADPNASAPSPFVGRRKDAISPHRERPGFFKRVFGSSRTNSGLSDRTDSQNASFDRLDHPDAPSRQKSHASAESRPRPETRKASKEPPKEVSYPPPSLNKKPSSFFRRRKKSNSDNGVPPAIPFNLNGLNHNLEVKPAQPSPSISSLRKVMDPFLNEDGTPAGVAKKEREESRAKPEANDPMDDDEDDDLDMFHSGYTPPPDASLRRQHPLSREPSVRKPSLGKENVKPQDGESPKMRIKMKKRAPEEIRYSDTYLGENSFLNDASGTSREPSVSTVSRLPTEVTFGSVSDEPSREPKISPVGEYPPEVTLPERPTLSRVSTGDEIIASASQTVSPVEAAQEMRDFSAGTGMSFNMSDESWVVTAPSIRHTDGRPHSNKSNRIFLQPTDSEEKLDEGSDGALSPLEGPHAASRGFSPIQSRTASLTQSPEQPSTKFHSATSLPLVQVEGADIPRASVEAHAVALASTTVIDDSAEYRERARKIYFGDEEDVMKAEAAAWLGEKSTISTRTLHAYMELFDFSGQNILSALRMLCNKLVLRGETQQVDRIIDAMSQRWCSCNPNHGFKAKDVVHTMCYSLVMLNTDLHLADIGDKMTRNQFVKNTLPTIKRVVSDAAPGAFEDTVRPGQLQSRPSLPWQDSSNSSVPTSPAFPPDGAEERSSLDVGRPLAKRLSIRPGTFRMDSDGLTPDSAGGSASNALVNNPWDGTIRGWEFEVETVLKSFFSSVRSEPLPLHGSAVIDMPSSNNLLGSSILKRSGSVVSKAPSDNTSYRSRPDFRSMTSRWHSKASRSRPKIYPTSTVASSRTSFDDNTSMWSPAQSSMWSKGSLGKTPTSMSVGSLGTHFMPSDYKQSIGFANALSQAIIREESVGSGDNESFRNVSGLLEDETLELAGAPWAKEGILKHKHHLESPDKKAKERSWNECFAVIEKGRLTLFSFNTSSKATSMSRHRNHHAKSGKAASVAASVVGGGNWTENAEQLDSFLLRQTIASTLPPPGYSKARPHVWALSLPSGAVHLFQVGTEDIATEFMSTANYWSACLSKEPLFGGVSNIEYGWSEDVINPALLNHTDSTPTPPSSMGNRHGGMHSSSGSISQLPRPSMQSSLRGSLDQSFGTTRVKLPGDKIQISDWHAPVQSMMPSQLMEVDQLKALTTYVANVEGELAKHNELRHALGLAFSPRHPNHTKSLNNWQRKSDYLLREIVKFRTYIDALTAAQVAKEKISAERLEHDSRRTYTMKGDRDVTPRQTLEPRQMKDDRDITPRAAGLPA